RSAIEEGENRASLHSDGSKGTLGKDRFFAKANLHHVGGELRSQTDRPSPQGLNPFKQNRPVRLQSQSTLVAIPAARKPQVSSGQCGLGGIESHFRQPDRVIFRWSLAWLIRLQQLAKTILRENLVNPAHLTRLSGQL